jgi:hypothetical protein
MKNQLPRRSTFHRLQHLILPALVAAAMLPAHAGVQEKSFKAPVMQTDDSSIFHVFFQNQFSNMYITPRGLIVEDEGLVWQPLLLIFADLYKGDGWLNNIKLTAGVWNSVHTQKSTNPNTTTPYWNEFDLILGLSATVFKDWTASATYLLFVSPVDDYEPPHNLELALSYSDHFLENLTPWGKLSINPYAKLFIEMDNKATVSSTDSSFNFELGLTPKYVFDFYPVAIEVPTFLTLPGDGFYSEDGVPGVFTTGGKITVPLNFIPNKYGSWSVYGGVQWYHVYNDGIAVGNTYLPSSATTRDPVQWYGGIQLFF